jgi:hypothetical protein
LFSSLGFFSYFICIVVGQLFQKQGRASCSARNFISICFFIGLQSLFCILLNSYCVVFCD